MPHRRQRQTSLTPQMPKAHPERAAWRRMLALLLLIAAAALALPGAPAFAAAPWHSGLPNFAALAREYGPAVVNIGVAREAAPRRDIDTLMRRLYGIAPQRPSAAEENTLGSGFIVSADGFILTNAHVVAHGAEIRVRLTDRREFAARLVGLDPVADVALLKIDAKDLPTVKIGNPAELDVGDWVLAIGAPYGFSNSVTAGIVSAKGRVLPGAEYMAFLQTDVPINPGNSGGPLFNMQGEVIGINSRIFSSSGGYQGLSFAIPIDAAMRIKTQLQARGRVTRGRIGIAVQEVNQALANSFRLPRPAGALISSVEPQGSGARAGLRSGDVILQVQGQDVVQSADALILIAGLPPGTMAQLTVWREGAARTLEVGVDHFDTPTTASMQPTEAPAPLGITVRSLLPRERQVLRTEDGVLVLRVNAAAVRAGVKPGDVILAVNGRPVDNLESLAEAAAEADGAAALLVQRGAARLFIPIEVPSAAVPAPAPGE